MILKAEDIRARVRIANHHPVSAANRWERSIPDLQVICVLAGCFTYQEKNHTDLLLVPGDFLFIEPNIRHSFFLSPPFEEGAIAGMHLELAPTGSWAEGSYRLSAAPQKVTHLADPSYLQDRFCHLAAVYQSYLPYRQELTNAIATEILLILAAYWGGEAERAARPSQRMEKILEYIRGHLDEPLTRQELAKEFHLTAGYVNSLFKVELGMSPSAVINRERAARAYQLIDREGAAVEEAALAVGFQDPFYFSRVFRQIYEMPPSRLLKQKTSEGRRKVEGG